MAVGQQWKHGWIPISPVAMRQKNHGRSVTAGSWVTKLAGGSVSAKHMDTAIRTGAGRSPKLKTAEAALPSKAPRDLKPGDVVHYYGVPVTVLSHPREGNVRGNKAVWGRRHDTGAHGRVDFLSNEPMDVHGREKVSAADAKAHTATLKDAVDAKRARLDAIKSDPFSRQKPKTPTVEDKGGHKAPSAPSQGNAVSRMMAGLDALSKEVGPESKPKPITDSQGRVWEHVGGDQWRHGHSRISRAMLRNLEAKGGNASAGHKGPSAPTAPDAKSMDNAIRGKGSGSSSTASQKVFDQDLTKINSQLEALGAVVTDADGSKHVDQSKAPAALIRSYLRLVQYGYANGLL